MHIERVREKLTKVVSSIRHILRNDRWLRRRAVRTINVGLFNACAVYAASVCYEVIMPVVGRCKTLTCQSIILLASVPVCRAVSTDAVQILVDVTPLDLEVVRRGIVFKI